mmetsp:Transcript_297/g.487  ORF Transcript_297/g.487 Transcript_297/m.487 type:complete len:607 (-) Transcript_297:122-1942(-)
MGQNRRLQLSITAKKLTNLHYALMGKSNPFAIVTVRGDNPDNHPTVIGHTEVVYNNLSPTYATNIILDGYRFGVPLYVEIGLFDFQSKLTGKTVRDLSAQSSVTNVSVTGNVTDSDVLTGIKDGTFDHKVMGTALFEVGEVLGARGNVAAKDIQTGGAVYVHIERSTVEGDLGQIKFQLRAQNIHNKRTLGTSSPYFELYRRVERPTGASWTSIYRSNVCRGDLNPVWEPASLDMETFCNGDMGRIIKFVVYDHRKGGKSKMIGAVEMSAQHFVESTADQPFEIIGKEGKFVGSLEITRADILSSKPVPPKGERRPSQMDRPPTEIIPKQISFGKRPEFLDYISGGCSISLAVAIDFTASNGNPGQEGTPHYFHPEAPNAWNDYEKAIFAVGSILAKYDSDQKFPVWGFGAKYDNVVRHCFQCGDEVEVEGVNGILEAYRGVFQTPLTMSYPTDFTEVIRTAGLYASHEQKTAEEEGKLSYTILLILTAGNVENVPETKLELNDASGTPLSVVIVGIGDADFTRMEFLDDHDPATDTGRDITKFVEFSDYKSYNALTEAVLDEIPDQLVDYFFEKGLLPGKAEVEEIENIKPQAADDDERTLTYFG